MKVEVRNLGVIKEAELDLKPLTIFVGPNNAGKTWLAYTFAGIMGTMGRSRYTTAYIQDEVQDLYPPLERAVQQVLEKGNAKIDLVQFVEEYGEIYINNVARFAKQWMRQYMSTVMVTFDSFEFHLNIATIKEDLSRKILNSIHERRLSFTQRRKSPLLSVLKEKGKRELFAYSSSKENIEEELPMRAVKEILVTSVFQILQTAFYPNTYILPVERSAYMALGSFSQLQKFATDPAILSLLEPYFETLLREKAIGPMNAPLGMFMDTMSTMFNTSTMLDREDAAKRNPEIMKYIELAKLLEESVLGGSVDFTTPQPDPNREILFKPSDDINLELTVSSSMIKELAPLVFYLRYILRPDDLLVIDEPEMNLHPVAQVQIIEILAMLVNAGLHILITTHSTYIIDHLTNLMDAFKHKNQEEIAAKFLLETKEAFISQEKVAVYGFDDGQVSSILDPQGIIDWKTFSDVTRLVERIHFELSGE